VILLPSASASDAAALAERLRAAAKAAGRDRVVIADAPAAAELPPPRDAASFGPAASYHEEPEPSGVRS
jgi:hypothetical protein